ncbi:MAG: hypothetical protein A2W26_13875 [Acidobacteria bacterium RBG_16_64_8]|nr:MAG: hypothetical protein A2W26_13875 [Acidobacteria bacterium RBG_16_64_8]
MEKSTNQRAPDAKTSGGQGIRDLIERTFLVGMGAAALTKDRVQELVEEFVRRGQISGDEGRDMVERLVSRSRDEARSAFKRADSSLQTAYRDMGLVSKRELEDMELRVRQLEHRVQLLEKSADAGPGGASTET